MSQPAQGLAIGTCQFAVSGSISRNAKAIRRQMEQAAKEGAKLVHFPETALSGYAGIDMPNYVDYDWDLLNRETESIMALAARLGVWVVLGSSHRLDTVAKPHNCLYLIDPKGRITDRYDKRFCLKAELRRYSPGDHWVVFKINKIRCALLICFDVRFPELYRALYAQGVQCLFQSFYNARQKGPSVHSDIMVQSMQCRAATNGFWVSMCNASGHYSPYGSAFIRPDGKVVKRLPRNRSAVMVNTVDPNHTLYDPMKGYREVAMQGQLNNGDCVTQDPRSKDRTCF
ncbi:MAG: carbon-nitrogen hydrolase family protein [Phycisphaeraceae bacterium]|nr:carbon-nitrogen hydrolase family protein [Phycisphaeraceae bacterium]